MKFSDGHKRLQFPSMTIKPPCSSIFEFHTCGVSCAETHTSDASPNCTQRMLKLLYRHSYDTLSSHAKCFHCFLNFVNIDCTNTLNAPETLIDYENAEQYAQYPPFSTLLYKSREDFVNYKLRNFLNCLPSKFDGKL